MKSILVTIFLLCGLTSVLWANPCPPDYFLLDAENEEIRISYERQYDFNYDEETGEYTYSSEQLPVHPLLRAEVEIISEDPWTEPPYNYEYIVHRVFELVEGNPLLIGETETIDPCVAPGTYAYLFLSYDSFGSLCDRAANFEFITIAEHAVSCPESGRELDMTTEEFQELGNTIYPGSENDFDFVTKDGDGPDVIPDEDADLNEEPEQENNDDLADAPVSDNESTPDEINDSPEMSDQQSNDEQSDISDTENDVEKDITDSMPEHEVNDADDHSVKKGGCSLTVL